MDKLVTAEEFANFPEPADGSSEELLRGEVIRSPIPSWLHGGAKVAVGALLFGFVRQRKLGWVTMSAGVVIERNPDSVFGPDVWFYSRDRSPVPPDGWLEGPPDLVVEVLSPEDQRPQMQEKFMTYVKNGVRLLWLVDPEVRTATVYTGSMHGIVLDESETITGGDVLPEFSCKVAEFFE